MVHELDSLCRMCGSAALEPAFFLPPTALANDFRLPEEGIYTEKVPLTVMVCADCDHSQLREHVSGDYLFKHYLYTTGVSPSFVKHFAEYADWMRKMFANLGKPHTVLEVGANDGTFLKALLVHRFDACGLESAQNLVDANRELPLICRDFGINFAREWTLKGGAPFDIVVGNNVFAHVESLQEMMQTLNAVTHEGSFFIAEVQYLPGLIANGAFDLVYHEHRDHHLVSPWQELLYKFNWRLYDAMKVPTHGGSIRIIARRGKVDGAFTTFAPPTERLAEILAEENTFNSKAEWRKLQRRVVDVKKELHQALSLYKSVAIYGAPAKLTTLSAGLELEKLPQLLYVVDDAPTKQGRACPGGRWAVHSSATLKMEPRLDAILIAAWNVKDDIVKKVRAAGITVPLIVPFPQVEVING